jgi:hypothetical protein
MLDRLGIGPADTLDAALEAVADHLLSSAGAAGVSAG